MIRYSERTGFCLGTERHCSAPLRAPSALMGSCSAGFLACAGAATEEASIKRTADPPPRQTGEFYFYNNWGNLTCHWHRRPCQNSVREAGHHENREFSNAIFLGE